ncbi:pilus (MSHA type) biogenesis protein MshL [Thiohalomonas denitrificans]|uniref:MSHA biogenesis protein MshL n=1 Tax=Thiohalomonas denitrificans TaxID=415747 RepID=A0A1G5QTH0_9GAMM|nr:pilus (MSHA type) biogenesis protein MshL [Thiohalomonas denitrificans]SCZ64976.1 MSHA biogenesis protein MshL [Thiohalomonas denitrificans]
MKNQEHCKSLLSLLALTVGLGGCAGIDRGETMSDIRAAAREGLQGAEPKDREPPPDLSSALMPELQVDIPGASEKVLDQHFDVKVRRAPARDFFLGLVEDTPYNIVVHPEVSGQIDLDLKNVTVPQVMAIVKDAYGYDFERRGSVFQVYPNTVQSRIFYVNYPDLVRTGYSGMETTSTSVADINGRTDDTRNERQNSRSARQGSGSSVGSASDSNFWERIRADVESIVGREEGRRVSVNPIAGLILVRAKPDELRDVGRFLDASAVAVKRQVVLEARILEVTLSDGYRAGINWMDVANSDGELAVFGPGGNLTGSVNTQGDSSVSVTDDLTLGLFGNDFTALIDALKTQGDVQVLSNPRVSTVNNQKAIIKVGSDEFFVTDVESDTIAGTATTTNTSVELTPFFSGVSLDVTPQISAEGQVILHIHPTVSQVAEQTKQITTSAGSLTLPLAASTVRESDTMIRAENGQIVVIGGLMQNRLNTSENRIPLLGDIPLLGGLFRFASESREKTELVILLKPTVVEGPAEWSRQVNDSLNTWEGMEQSRKRDLEMSPGADHFR